MSTRDKRTGTCELTNYERLYREIGDALVVGGYWKVRKVFMETLARRLNMQGVIAPIRNYEFTRGPKDETD